MRSRLPGCCLAQVSGEEIRLVLPLWIHLRAFIDLLDIFQPIPQLELRLPYRLYVARLVPLSLVLLRFLKCESTRCHWTDPQLLLRLLVYFHIDDICALVKRMQLWFPDGVLLIQPVWVDV